MLLECKYNSFGIFNDKFKIGPAKWDCFDLLFVHDGHIVIWPTGKFRLELKTGQSVLIYPQTEFDGYSMVDCTRVSVQHFLITDSSELPEDLSQFIKRKNGCQSFLRPPDRQVERDIERLVNMRHSANLECIDMEMMSSIMLLVLLGVFKAQGQPVVYRGNEFGAFFSYLERKINENVSLEEMAAVCGLSVSRFRAKFKKLFFQSPGDYFRSMKMANIARQLRETTTPIKEISRHSGFNMLPNFYRAFRSVYGMSPAEYRNRNILKG